jgi:hypothetical protein
MLGAGPIFHARRLASELASGAMLCGHHENSLQKSHGSRQADALIATSFRKPVRIFPRRENMKGVEKREQKSKSIESQQLHIKGFDTSSVAIFACICRTVDRCVRPVSRRREPRTPCLDSLG